MARPGQALRKIIPVLLISMGLGLLLVLAMAGLTTAQAPNPSSASKPGLSAAVQGSAPITPLLRIERALLPKIDPQLLKKLLETNNSATPFIVYLKATTNLSAAVAAAPVISAQGVSDPFLARRTAIVNALQQTAQASQAGLLQTLQSAAAAGVSGQNVAATDIRPLWIVNAVAARGTLETILELAARPEVQIIRLDKEIKLEEITGRQPAFTFPFANLPTNQLSNPEWGIAKIRADLVHNALGIDGKGVVVANIDSGVDWLHPALQTKYRGYTGPGKLPQHPGNWYDATGAGAVYPVDSNGHGTHTMGTIVGANGVGVAPGAQWIAVKAFNSAGLGQNSWLHAAFQWVLAPNGDPALAPHVINNSWSNNNGGSTEFYADTQALLNAGIYPVFAAGNNGPDSNTVGSPGSFDIAFAVGAIDINDDITIFSGRGPSPWGQLKPQVTAPGKDVVSTLPGGAYGSSDGTSMATPHVTGLAALLLQASPALSNNPGQISNVMTSTAVVLGTTIPNYVYGWGRIDAYNAVIAVASLGTLQGTITRAGSNTPISNATLQITPRGGGPTINATSDAGGAYRQSLAANTYDVTASAFGYVPATAFNVGVGANGSTTQNFSLTLQPVGVLQGVVTEAGTNTPLAATIIVDGTPAATVTDPANGGYSLFLPIGTYTVRAVAAEHRIQVVENITINDGATLTQNFSLVKAPRILLVDSGRWYQESKIGYYQQALNDALYPYELWQITNPFTTPNNVPISTTLTQYDVVIWSSPEDSPGYIRADLALEGFLKAGGKLLLSGQNVAYFDGGGYIFNVTSYLDNYLKATYVQDNSEIYTLTGLAGEPFAGLTFSIAGGDGANNQTSPDVIAVTDHDFAAPLAAYDGDGLAGSHIGLCLDYRAIFLPFGFEAINSRATRSAAMESAIAWLTQPPAPAGVELTPLQATRVGRFGTVVSHTIRLRNTGTGHDTYSFSLAGQWPVNPAAPGPISLPSCESQQLILDVTVNTNIWDTADVLTLTARSGNNPALTDAVTRITKSPAPLLLVDDDRFYSFAAEYKAALETNKIPYDYYQVPKAWSGLEPPSPSLETLQMYPMVVWYTAYDWFQPLTTAEEERLATYLEGGGRLFFSGQDYIYNLPGHQPGPFARTYLGILSHTEDYSSTQVIGQRRNLIGDHLGPYPLVFPLGYNNWTDALEPMPAAQVATFGQEGQVNGLMQAGLGASGLPWHTTFLSYGLELLSPAQRARLMQRSVGWLNWLGSSTVRPHVSASLDNEVITYTAILTNNGWTDLSTAHFTATFPAELTLRSFSPELTLSNGNLIWSGPLVRNQPKIFVYSAAIAGSLPIGVVLSQTNWLDYAEHKILFDRIATVYVNFPDLQASSFNSTPAQGVETRDILTYTLVLKNTGLVDDPMVTTTNTLPHMLELIGVDPPSQGNVAINGKTIRWTTPLAKDGVATLTYRTVISYRSSTPIRNIAYVNDNINDQLILKAITSYQAHDNFLPVILKN